jgi:hypothetical protein
MSNTASTITIIGATLVIVLGVAGLQTYWISRSLDALGGRVDGIESRLGRIEGQLVALVERVARIEGRGTAERERS